MITKQINLNSKNGQKLNGSFNSNIFFNFPNIVDSKNIKSVDFTIENAQIPVSFYNINDYNNLLSISINGGIENILSLTLGNYNSSSLIQEILNRLSDLSITNLTFETSEINGLFHISIDAGYFTLHYLNSTIFNVLGFIETQDHTSTTQNLYSNYPLNLLGTLKLKIKSQKIIIDNLDSKNYATTSTLLEIPINAKPFGLIMFSNNSLIHNALKNINLNGFDIYILDDNDNYVNFNNIDWSISILLKINIDTINTDPKFPDISIANNSQTTNENNVDENENDDEEMKILTQ
jgi:hypothetical protein